jgi:hypothetical protein
LIYGQAAIIICSSKAGEKYTLLDNLKQPLIKEEHR